MNYRRISLGLALLALSAIACSLPWNLSSSGSTGGNFASNGQRIYVTGTSTNNTITYTWSGMMGGQQGMMGGQGGMMQGGMMGGQLACVMCHGADGRGLNNALNTGVDAPDIRWAALTSAEHDEHEGDDHEMDHPPYTEETFKQAVTQGVDPGNHSLKPVMPRWRMSDQDLNDLIAFLKTLP